MRRINYVVDIKIGMDNEKQAVINNTMNTNQQREHEKQLLATSVSLMPENRLRCLYSKHNLDLDEESFNNRKCIGRPQSNTNPPTNELQSV